MVFSAPHKPALSEMIAIAKYLPEHIAPIFLLPFYDKELDEKMNAEGWRVCYFCPIPKNGGDRQIHKKAGFVKGLLDNGWFGCFAQAYLLKGVFKNKLLLRLNKIYDRIGSELCNEEEIIKVVISNDRSAGLEAALNKWAMEQGIGVIIPPIAYASDFSAAIKLRKARIYGFVRSDIPKVTMEFSHGAVIKSFYRPFETEALKEFGVLSSNPWVLGSGHCDFMLVESEREKRRLIALGGDKEKMVVTGHLSHDSIWNALSNKDAIKKSIIAKYKLSEDKPFVLLAAPQYWEHGLCDKKSHFDIIEQLCQSLGAENNLIISLHPKMDRADYSYLEDKYRVKIVHESLRDVIVISDLFVATYSSTIAWALLCNKKVMIVDFIGLSYSSFYEEFEIDRICNTEQLKVAMQFFDKEDINRSNKDKEDLCGLLSPFDGACASRIIDNIVAE